MVARTKIVRTMPADRAHAQGSMIRVEATGPGIEEQTLRFEHALKG